MSRSNRVMNRIILVLLGLVLVAVAAGVALVGFEGKTSLFGGAIVVPDVTLPKATSAVLWIIAASVAVAVILALVWIFSRGRGRTSTLVDLRLADGEIAIDVDFAADLLGDALEGTHDVSATHVRGYSVRSTPTLEVRVVARRGADLRGIIDAVALATTRLDLVLEQRIPVLLHVVSAVRPDRAHENRAR